MSHLVVVYFFIQVFSLFLIVALYIYESLDLTSLKKYLDVN